MSRELDTIQVDHKDAEDSNITRIDYFISILIVCISGNPAIVMGTPWYGVFAVFIMLLICLVFRRPFVNVTFIKWMLGFLFLFILQGIVLSEVSVPAEINFIAKLYVVFLAVSFLGAKFRNAYFRVMYLISAISLVFFFLNCLGVSIGLEYEKYRTIFVYNSLIQLEDAHVFRNCGMFWEPGAFQGYIMLAFLLYINEYKSLWKEQRLKCIVLLLALLTTYSTTGYVAFLLYVAYIICTCRIHFLAKAFLMIMTLACCIHAYNTVDFLGEKIEAQYGNAKTLSSGDVSWTRMGAMKIDLQQISRHPLIGNGFVMTSRYEKLGDEMIGSGNGFTGAMNMLGIPCLVIYFMALYKSLNFNEKKPRFFFLFMIVVLLNGEFFLDYPLFWGLPFMTLPDRN